MTYIYIMHTLILLLLGSTSAFLHQPGQRVTLSPLKRLSLFSYRPTTYTAVNIPTKAQYPLLIKDSERSLIEQASNFKSFAESESSIVQSWIEKGAAFWSDSAGIEALHITEHSTRVLSQSLVSAKGWLAADLYVDCGEEGSPIYIDRKKYDQLHGDGKLYSKGSGRAQDPSLVADLVRRGYAYTNATQLFTAEQVLHRADNIATRLKEEFPISSPEWSRWTNRTAEYNTTSLTQVFGSYFAEQSIGDVGGKDYVPKAGYVGTLAPGEKFKDNYGIEELPRKVLHPWPAMQQIQFHVRWPPSHPMIPPPLLWLALNNMYTENFTTTQLSEQMARPDDRIIGGTFMEPRDALRIARGASFGLSYDPAEQIPHGGMEFDAGYDIPHYHPDHPPTVSAAEAKVDIPEELLPITERWMDPYYGLDTMMTQGAEREGEGEEDAQGAAQVMAEAQSEEERRRRVIESLLAGVPYPPDNIDDDDVDAENMTGEVHRQDRAGEENNGVVPAEQMLPWRRAEMEARAALEQAVSERVKAHQEAMLRERTELEEEELRMLEKDFSTGAGGGGDATAASVARAYDTVHKRATLNVNVNMNSVSINEQASDRVESEEDLKVRFRKEIEMAQELTTASKGRARGRRQLIKYTIESMESLMNEIVATERGAGSRKAGPGRKKGKKSSSVGGGAAEVGDGETLLLDTDVDPDSEEDALLEPADEEGDGGFEDDAGRDFADFGSGLDDQELF